MPLGGKRPGAGHPTTAQKTRKTKTAAAADADFRGRARRRGKKIFDLLMAAAEKGDVRATIFLAEAGFGKASQVPTETPESQINVIAFPGWRTGSDNGGDPEGPDPDEARLELGPVGVDAGPGDAGEVGESPG